MSAIRVGSMQFEPTLLAAPSPTAGNHGTLAQGWPAAAPRRAQASAPAASGQRQELLGLDAGRGQRLRIPAQRVLIKQPRPRGHRHTRRRLAEERELQMLADRSPGGDAADLGRPLAPQPAELGRPVRAVQMTPRPVVEARVVERAAQQRGVGRAARVGPGEDRRDRPPGGVEAEQPMPEGRDADRLDVVVREARVIASRQVATASSSTPGSCSTPPSWVSVGS